MLYSSDEDRETAVVRRLTTIKKPFERGQFYVKAIEGGYYPSFRKLVEVLGCRLSESKCLSMAKFPQLILGAFASPSGMQVAWQAKITMCLLKDPDRIMARAQNITHRRSSGEKIPAKQVYKELVAH